MKAFHDQKEQDFLRNSFPCFLDNEKSNAYNQRVCISALHRVQSVS